VHSTAPPSRRQAGQPISSAECLLHGAAHALQHTTPRPAPPRPAINVDVGAPSIAPSAHANRAGASREVDVADDGTHATGGVEALEWLAANLGGGGVAAGGTGADVSVGVDVDAVVGVGVHGQGVNLGVGLGVGLVVGPPPLTSLDS